MSAVANVTPLLDNEVPRIDTGLVQFDVLRKLVDKLEQDAVTSHDAASVRGPAAGAAAPVTGTVTSKRRRFAPVNAIAASAPRPNVPTFEELLEDFRQLGEQKGKGENSQIGSILKAVEGSYLGVFDRQKDKHGTGVDDATRLAEAYLLSRSKNALFDRKAPTSRKTASYIRKAIELGAWSKGGPGEPLQTVNNLMAIWRDLRKRNTAGMEDAVNAFQKFQRVQLKRDTVCTDAELKSFCFVPVRDMRTDAEIIEAVRKSIGKLINGKAEKGNVKNDMPEVKAIFDKCTKALTAIAKAKAPQSTQPQPPTP